MKDNSIDPFGKNSFGLKSIYLSYAFPLIENIEAEQFTKAVPTSV